MRALVQSQRFTVYTIIDSLVAHHRDGKVEFPFHNPSLTVVSLEKYE
jgi:hypothetical protein